MDITNYDQNAYTFVPTHGDKTTAYHCHMISVVYIFNSNTLKVCWWITQLHIWVVLMIIWILHHVPNK